MMQSLLSSVLSIDNAASLVLEDRNQNIPIEVGIAVKVELEVDVKRLEINVEEGKEGVSISDGNNVCTTSDLGANSQEQILQSKSQEIESFIKNNTKEISSKEKKALSDLLVSDLLIAVNHLKVIFESNISLGKYYYTLFHIRYSIY